MTVRMERRRIARVPFSGTLTVWAHNGVEARLLDLSLAGARLAHSGTLRPGARCLLLLPAELGAVRLSAQTMWCTILGAAVGADGERYLQAQSGLAFPGLSEAQRAGLAGLLQQAGTEMLSGRVPAPQAGDLSRDFPRLMRGGAAVRLPGQPGRGTNEPFLRLVGSRRTGSLAS